jgi:hypothetical protein
MSRSVEEKQHAAVVAALTTHFSHSSVESDIEDAAWTVLNVLDDFIIPDPSTFPKLRARMAEEPSWEASK